jgi:hypothetical protein
MAVCVYCLGIILWVHDTFVHAKYFSKYLICHPCAGTAFHVSLVVKLRVRRLHTCSPDDPAADSSEATILEHSVVDMAEGRSIQLIKGFDDGGVAGDQTL